MLNDRKFIIPILLFVCTLIPLVATGSTTSWPIELLFVLNMQICIVCLFKNQDHPYTLSKTFFLFTFFFFCIAPYFQFRNNTTFWGGAAIHNNAYIIGNSIILASLILYIFFYGIASKFPTKNNQKETPSMPAKTQTELAFAMLSGFSCLIVLWSFDFNILKLIYRDAETDIPSLNSSLQLIVNFFIRPLPVFIYLYYRATPSPKRWLSIVFILLALITCFPTSLPRNQVAALYIPIVIAIIPWMSKKNIFTLTLIVGLLFIFPLLNQFRSVSIYNDSSLSLNFDLFLEPHFDAYQNFMRVVEYNIITYGKQALGAILFFVPRSIWPSKPIGSGSFSSNLIGLSFDNISMPYLAEGYINFGIAGIILFTVLLAIYSAKLDKFFWKKNNHTTQEKLIYTTLVPMVFFIMRGDLLSSTAYTTGLIFSILFINKIYHLFNRIKLSI